MHKQEYVGDVFHQEALQCPHGTDRLGTGPLPDVVPGEWVDWIEVVALCDRVESTEHP